MANQIWIELDAPRDDTHAEEMCEQANRMLARLGDTAGQKFSWDAKHKAYRFGGTMGDEHLPDRGKWFNLDYLGREFGSAR